MSPACVAWIVQVPTETSVTVVPDTVQTAGVVEAKLTPLPDDALALTLNGAVPKTWFESAPKVMVWGAGVVTVSVTGMTNGLFDAWDDVSVTFPLYVPTERPPSINTRTDPGVVPPHPFEVGLPLPITLNHGALVDA